MILCQGGLVASSVGAGRWTLTDVCVRECMIESSLGAGSVCCRYLRLPVAGAGHGVRRRQRLVGPHRVCGAHRARLQHDPRGSALSRLHHDRPALPHTIHSPPPHQIDTHNTLHHKNQLLFTMGREKIRSKASLQRKEKCTEPRIHTSLRENDVVWQYPSRPCSWP